MTSPAPPLVPDGSTLGGPKGHTTGDAPAPEDTLPSGTWRSPFSADLPTWQTTWDSTSLGWLKSCAQMYKYMMIDQWSPRTTGLHLRFGQLYAGGVEHYAHYRADGLSHDAATVKMVKWVLEAAGERQPCQGCAGNGGDLASGICIECHGEGSYWLPWNPPPDHKDANIKNRYTLIRSLVWNVDERETSPFTTVILASGRPAVELTFNFHAFDIADTPIHLSGHLDEIVQSDDTQKWIRDDKTTKSPLTAHYFKQYSPGNQMSLYSVAGKVVFNEPVRGVLVKAAQIGVGFTRFATAQVPRPPSVLAEWLEDAKLWIEAAKLYAERNYWPKNDKSCDKFGGCPFQKVCSVSPSHRDAWLAEDFEKREWNPLQSRGDI